LWLGRGGLVVGWWTFFGGAGERVGGWERVGGEWGGVGRGGEA